MLPSSTLCLAEGSRVNICVTLKLDIDRSLAEIMLGMICFKDHFNYIRRDVHLLATTPSPLAVAHKSCISISNCK